VRRYVLDTSVFIAAARDRQVAERLERFSSAHLPSLHLSAVVAQEMLAGALDPPRERLIRRSLIEPWERRGRVLVPSFRAWVRAGSIMARLVQQGHLSPGGFARSFTNDCLIAASCAEHGATLVTFNLRDFALIRRVEDIAVEAPFPGEA
jgi:predicted nucleic acid-binding protein